MGFNLEEPSVFINIKLTDVGRRQLSLGQLTFNQAVLSDREIDYKIDRINGYDILNNRVISPADFHPSLISNFDGSTAIDLSESNVASAKQIVTATTITYGFFTGSTNAFAIDNEKILGGGFPLIGGAFAFNTITYSTYLPDGTNVITLDNPGGSYFPNVGDLLFIPWEPIQNSGKTYVADTTIVSGNPTNMLWYKVADTDSATIVTLDRPVPDFGSVATSQKINVYVYPFNGIETFYGSATTVDASVWNMNVVRTNSVEGTQVGTSGFTSYGSIEFNGAKQYFGFSSETPSFGIIHYTNQFSGNTYAEQLVETTVKLDLPLVMWHNVSDDNGQAQSFGIQLSDVNGSAIFDDIAQTTYKELKDGTVDTSNVVGRVYHKLEMIIITDQELLAAMTYKSNRNFTLPPLQLTSSATPKFPLANSQATGLLNDNKTYFVTYIVESEPQYEPGVSFGYGQTLHCSYIQKIEGKTDSAGNTQFLAARFPVNSFPYLRSSANMDALSSFSGTGWNANKVQLLINEVDSTSGYQEGSVPSTGWKKISSVVGNGIYTGETGDSTIDPLKLAGFQFIVSREDYNSGTTYSLDPVFTDGMSALTFGQESFFYGNVETSILATTFKTLITVFARNNEFNSSLNPSFDSSVDENTYITEIGILDANNNLVAVGKPTNPVRKSEGRFLAFQLEIDF